MLHAQECALIALPKRLSPSSLPLSWQVRSDLDHRAYMPAAWRVDEYLDAEEDDEAAAGDSLAALRAHRFEAVKDRKDTMTRCAAGEAAEGAVSRVLV